MSTSIPSALPPLPAHPLVYGSILDLVGDSPILELRRFGTDLPRATLLAKSELVNPGGSVKDRICLAIIEAAERQGLLGPGGVVVEPTSGNTGIGLALVCTVKGYRCILTMPETMSLERRQLLEAFGAELVLTPGEQQMEGAVVKAREIAAQTPRAFCPSQFDNPENPRCHRETTAREILHVMRDRSIDAFVAGVGTGGTITGVGAALRRERREARIIAVEPKNSASLSGGERGPTKIQGLAAGFVPRNFDREVVHEIRVVSDRDAYDAKVALARNEGLLVGISAGGAVHVALEVARELGPGKNVVTLLPDTGERYFSLDEYFA
ncbi:MAG TPA: cysteine synthase A [Polyangiaceae bacterium]|nr:cysteine synthase A [Polyangiaceae bacterium]